MTRLRLATVAAAVLFALAGCGSDTPTTPAAATNEPTPSGSASASPTPVVDETLKLGDSYQSSGGEVTSTVYRYRQPVAKSAPRPEQSGYEWGAADVKVCTRKDYAGDPIVVSDRRWVLAYADDTQIEVTDTGYEAHPEPAYPWEKELAPGRCVRGWITYAVPAGKRPVAVEYVASSERVPPRWAVG